MPSALRTIALQPPLGGIVRRHAIQSQAPFTTPAALNVWTQDYSVSVDGRECIATRPGLTTTGESVATPYNWAPTAFYASSTLRRGIMVTHSSGTSIFIVDGSGNVDNLGEVISTDPATDFASNATFMGKPYQARGGGTLIAGNFASFGAGTAVTNAPANCGLVCAHGTRLFLAGDTTSPMTVYASRIGGDSTSPGDLSTGATAGEAWDFAEVDDDAAAWASTGANGGLLQEPVTALMSHTRDCLIIGMTDSMSVLRGNPRNGEFEQINDYCAPLNQASWTHDTNGNLWYLGRDGLYKMPAGCGDFSQSISREALPNDLVALNPGISGTYTSLAYDPRFRALWVFVDLDGSSNDVAWSYDLQTGAWWQHTFSAGPIRLGATLKPAGSSTKSSLLAFDAGGTAYQFNTASTESFTSYVWFGPIQLGGPANEGLLHSIQASLASDSDDVDWSVHVGKTAEEAFESSAAFTGTDWEDGLNYWQHPRRRGAYAYVKVGATTTRRWALETITVKLAAAGLRRL